MNWLTVYLFELWMIVILKIGYHWWVGNINLL